MPSESPDTTDSPTRGRNRGFRSHPCFCNRDLLRHNWCPRAAMSQGYESQSHLGNHLCRLVYHIKPVYARGQAASNVSLLFCLDVLGFTYAMQGRRRRKKCDELAPMCTSCKQHDTNCTWPSSSNQPADRRRWASRRKLSANHDMLLPSPFRTNDEDIFFHFCVNHLLPLLVRRECPAVYSDHTYMVELASDFPPLKAIMTGLGALATGMPSNLLVAMENYDATLHRLKSFIAAPERFANDDKLLATALCLCVFEVRLVFPRLVP